MFSLLLWWLVASVVLTSSALSKYPCRSRTAVAPLERLKILLQVYFFNYDRN